MSWTSLLTHLPLLKRWPLVSVVRLSGVIGGTGLVGAGLSLAGVAPVLARAFAPARLTAVALAINSPGGSPVQSALIASRIRALAAERKVPVIGFVEDVAASGGYWLACAADEIFADPSSFVGSIGVITAGFGFHDLIARFGIERRVYTAGARKMLLDPFRPAGAEDVDRLKALQGEIFENFKAMVRDRRTGRLKVPEDQLFTGEFWTGRRALELGLIDGLGDLRTVLRDRFGTKVKLRLIQSERGWLRRRTGVAPGLEAAAATLFASLDERAAWARYGL